MSLPFFIIARALGKATTFSLGWATSLFFGQIPGGKERVVSMASAIAFAWFLITYVGGGFAAAILLLHAAGRFALDDPVIGDGRMQAVALGIVLLPPLMTYIAEKSDLNEEFSLVRWLKRLHTSYPVALSLGAGVALMLIIGPIVLLRRRRAPRPARTLRRRWSTRYPLLQPLFPHPDSDRTSHSPRRRWPAHGRSAR